MTTVPLSEAKDRLSALVDQVEQTHDIVTVTRHGKPAAVLISADDLESMRETIFWLSQPGIGEDIAEGEREYHAGEVVSGDQLRAEFGLPPRRG